MPIIVSTEKRKELEREIWERTVGYVVAAFGFVAGLAWNEAIKALIEYFFPLSTNTVLAKFLYALIVTILVVLVTVYLVRIGKKSEEKQ